jgi:hypothetical protein
VCLADANEGFWIAKLDKKNNLHSSEKDLKHIYLYENFANVLPPICSGEKQNVQSV